MDSFRKLQHFASSSLLCADSKGPKSPIAHDGKPLLLFQNAAAKLSALAHTQT